MKTLNQITFATLTTIILAFTLCSSWQASAAPPPESSPAAVSTNSTPQKAVPPEAPKPVIQKTITGAELYSINCNRCHPERYPTERTAAQWKTIMLHMQVRANIPASQARLILKYLQDNSGR